MSYFLKSGNTFRVASDEAMDIHRKLPVGNYVIKLNEMSGELYLEGIDDFNTYCPLISPTSSRK